MDQAPSGDNEDVRRLICAIRNGDQQAYSKVMQLYQRRVIALALMIVRDSGGAEDVAQDAFVRAYTHLDRYDEQREFYPWLATITVRLARNWLRTEARTTAREDVFVADETETNISLDSLDEIIADESGRKLWHSVASLPSGERTATLLYYRQEMKVVDIAAAMDVSSGTIKTMLFRARQKLRVALEEDKLESEN
ncbi:MAG: RNA polymerase sigma factor [Gammaproteobacteria bacterium]|jgi:RNA polymerase sigma-70 factor, ECF subfamily|nr:RNA polymerase sigma factor [Gammaproteobacteria bacterium]